jgi:FkbM family methyltransferase
LASARDGTLSAPRVEVIGVTSRLKSTALRLLPDAVLHVAKRWRYLRALKSLDSSEEPDLQLVPYLVADAERVVDVGANYGVYTKVLSELVGPNGRVFSVEPMPDTFALLQHNVRALQLRNVMPLRSAASDAEATVEMEIPLLPGGGSNFYQARIVPAEPRVSPRLRRVSVRASRLDALEPLAQEDVSFIKIDVEGHELEALRGADGLLRRSRPALLVEIWGDPDEPGSRAQAVFDYLEQRELLPFHRAAGRLVPRRRGERATNYFFLSEERLRKAESRGLPVSL